MYNEAKHGGIKPTRTVVGTGTATVSFNVTNGTPYYTNQILGGTVFTVTPNTGRRDEA